MNSKPNVSIIIANFNGEEYLDVCLSSVLKSSYKKFDIVIVDDGSTDESSQILEVFAKKDERVKVLKNSKNMGAAASRNIAFGKVKGEIIIFLDNDTEVRENWISELIEPILVDSSIGASQSLLLDFKKRNLIQMAGGLLIPQTGWLIPFHQWKKHDKVRPVERDIVAISAALAVRRDVFEKINGFDEKEAIYTEDLDLCWRIWIAGYRVVLAPQSHVFHWTKSVEKRSGMKASYKQIYFHLAKNSFRSVIKNYEFINILKYLPVSIFINVGRGFLFLVSRRRLDALLGSLSGVVFLLGNLPDTIKIRKVVQAGRRFSDKYLMKRIFTSENLVQVYNKHFRQ